MRFEIGPGGGIIILVGLLGLSAVVFFLGMISGREMAQTEQGQSQLAAVYPMPGGAPGSSPPEAAEPAAPVAAATLTAPPRAEAAPKNTSPTALPKAPSNRALASVSPAHRAAPAPEAEESDDSSDSTDSSASSDRSSAGTEEGAASAPTPSAGTRARGYYIVIDAAMDHAAANRLASRLSGLGYTSHMSPSEVDGKTWYRVRVGPYATPDDARAAQAQLRAAYAARYVNRASAASARRSSGAAAGAAATNAGSADTDGSDSGAADTDSDDSGGGDSAPAPSAPSD